MRRRSPWLLLLAITAACGSAGAATEVATLRTPPPTVPGVGALPDTIPPVAAAEAPLVVVTRPVTDEGVLVELVGDQINGNRLIVIGDSIFAAAASRYGGKMCEGLTPLGWSVQVEAEAGRFVEFGNKVLDRLLPEVADDEPTDSGGDDADQEDDDWDAAAVFLGSNYAGDQQDYEAELREIVERLAPRPTLLFTVTEYRPSWSEVNDVISRVADEHDHVTIIEWGDVAKTPGVLRNDGLHPSDEGTTVLVELTAAALGRARGVEGECLGAVFTDDSAIDANAGEPDLPQSGGSSRGSSSGGSSSGGSTTGGSTTGGSTTGGGTTTTTMPGGSTGGGTTGGGTTTTTMPGGSTGGG